MFVLGSLAEGFGRVYIEALSQGVPVFCHDYPVGRFLNGHEVAYGDFSKPGALAVLLAQRQDLFSEDPASAWRRWEYARDNFGWRALAPKYHDIRNGRGAACVDGVCGGGRNPGLGT
ncbi:glycosyltransferase [Porphyrobacter sp. LM 6]|uniref:glycosyltransferase n=1 Tax=Porphyrobacter sp. LM 6 TaxID=1896196 RepID=UPI0009F67457|nr:glycosyltransferase [Porphyrobacter sp. LM 6]